MAKKKKEGSGFVGRGRKRGWGREGLGEGWRREGEGLVMGVGGGKERQENQRRKKNKINK